MTHHLPATSDLGASAVTQPSPVSPAAGRRCAPWKPLLFAACLALAGAAEAAFIRVVDAGVAGNVGVVTAVSSLTALGHTVETGGTLADYSAYEQVWDLRYQGNFTDADVTAFESYLAGGGRVYLSGENPSFDASRNASLRALLAGVGGGDLVYGSTLASNSQTFTAPGALLRAPNAFSTLAYVGARTVTDAGNGFLVTESSPGAGGSVVAWDFGDIVGAPGARMIALWDIDVFRPNTANGAAWVQNMVCFLDATAPVANPPGGVIPEPSALALAGLGLALIGLKRRARRRAS